MATLNERLDSIKFMIQDPDFLEGKGLSNEVNIRFFCYDPKQEMTIRHFLSQLESENLKCNMIHYDLYEVFLDILRDKHILDKVDSLEEKRGKEFIGKQFEKNIDAKTFAAKLDYPNHQKNDLIILSGVGKVFPFMRVHSLLEAMQPLFPDVAVLVFYPGEFDGHYVRLFNKLKKNEYYRAFKAV